MTDLFPTWDTPELVDATQEATVQYGKSYSFNFVKGDFNLDGAGRVKETDGHTAWAHWCIKTVLIQRLAYMAYEAEYGTELDQVRQQPSRKAQQAEMKRIITEALMADPRTEIMEAFAFEHAGDEIRVSFTAVPTIGTSVRLEVKLNV